MVDDIPFGIPMKQIDPTGGPGTANEPHLISGLDPLQGAITLIVTSITPH